MLIANRRGNVGGTDTFGVDVALRGECVEGRKPPRLVTVAEREYGESGEVQLDVTSESAARFPTHWSRSFLYCVFTALPSILSESWEVALFGTTPPTWFR